MFDGLRTTRMIILATIAWAAGCRSPTPAEAPLAAQARRVREGLTRKIEVQDSSVSDDDLAALDGLTRLDELRLLNTTITDRGVERLAKLDGLRVLGITSPHLTDAALRHIVGLEQLETLRLESASFTDAGIEPLAKLPNLRHLILVDVPLTDSSVPHIAAPAKLESVYLYGTKITDEGIEELDRLHPGLHLHW